MTNATAPKTLTHADVATLTARFEPDEHEVKPQLSYGKKKEKGYQLFLPYVGEEAINLRLSQVDPGWTFTIDNVVCRSDHYAVYATLTVRGVSRQGVGTDSNHEDENAEKGAATDALKRTARLFGVGAYLKRSPDIYVDMAKTKAQEERAAMVKLRKWLASGDNAASPSSTNNDDNDDNAGGGNDEASEKPSATLSTIDDADQAFAAPFFKDGVFDGGRLYKAAAKQELLDELKDRLQEACGTMDMRQIEPANAIAAWKFVLDEQNADAGEDDDPRQPHEVLDSILSKSAKVDKAKRDADKTPSPDDTPPPELETSTDEGNQGKA
jgi:hypothetical protein